MTGLLFCCVVVSVCLRLSSTQNWKKREKEEKEKKKEEPEKYDHMVMIIAANKEHKRNVTKVAALGKDKELGHF